MKYALLGLRAGTISAFILTLWSFLGVMGPLEEASEASGLLYVATAYGVLGFPELLFALALGVLIAIWHTTLKKSLGDGWVKALAKPDLDRRVASMILAAPIGAGIVAVFMRFVHVLVTSKFQRVTFQSLGLALAAAAAVVGVLLISPLLTGGIGAVLGRIPPLSSEDSDKPRATIASLLLLAVGGLVVMIGGYFYAAGLNVWPAQTLQMGVAFVVMPVLFIAVMMKFEIKRIAWQIGVPIAGLLVALFCFYGAWGWSSSNADMSSATTQKSKLLSVFAARLQPFADKDKDGYAGSMGGIDCDDNNPEIFPGAKDVPGNGIDEDCSGKDAPLPSFEDHPSRKIVKRALDAANNAAIKKAEQIPDPPKNVVVILIDTLRADHMGFMGYERKTSPNIDALAAESIIFEDAYATAPHTPRSIPCLFFGRYPSHIKWRGGQYNYPKVRPENLSMFEVLQENGWKNYGFSSHFYFQEKRGMWQGFEAWDNEGAGTIAESNEDIASPRTWAKTEPKLAELAAASKKEGAAPFGVFLHLFEPHSRWIGHDEYDFGKGDTPAERHINNYDSEIAYVDAYVGKVVAKLKALGIYDDTVIILTSDHGEAFQDHGLFFHGQNLYDEVIKVPLLIRVPGWKPRRVEGPISLVDVAPTYLDLMDISVPQDFEGQSLVATMLGKAPVPDRPIFSELLPYTNWKEHHKVIIQGDLKYIRVLTSNTQQLYDLSKDPKEKNDLSRTNKEDVEKMRAKLDAWMSGG
jgi:arylsulfatase A-like enzyme